MSPWVVGELLVERLGDVPEAESEAKGWRKRVVDAAGVFWDRLNDMLCVSRASVGVGFSWKMARQDMIYVWPKSPS